MTLLEIVATTGGGILLLVTFYDLFQTVVLPRPAVRKFQLARTVVRPMWRAWRWVALRSTRVDRSGLLFVHARLTRHIGQYSHHVGQSPDFGSCATSPWRIRSTRPTASSRERST